LLNIESIFLPGSRRAGEVTVKREEVAQRIRERLRAVALGTLATLDFKAFSRYHTDFPTLLVEKPRAAYELLVETFRGPARARIVLRSILLPITGDPVKAIEAIKALEEDDEEKFKRLIGLK
jgi:hypothetical protein